MPPPLEIEFVTAGAAALLKQLDRISVSLAQMNSAAGAGGLGKAAADMNSAAKALAFASVAVDKATTGLRAAAMTLAGAASSQKLGGAGGNAGTPNPPGSGQNANVPQSPQNKLSNLQNQYMNALANNNQTAMSNLIIAIGTTKKNVINQNNKPQWQNNFGQGSGGGGHSMAGKLWNVLKTSRYGLPGSGVGLMPLVGRTIAALGPIPTAALSAAGAIYALAKGAAEAADKFSRLQFATGSSGLNAAGLGGIGASVGMGGGAVGSAVSGVHERITSDPMARAIAAQAGVSNIPGVFGNQDWGKEAIDIIEWLRKIKDKSERLRMARGIGATEFLPATQMSDSQWNKVKPGSEDSKIKDEIFGGNFAEKSADFLSSVSRVGEAVENLIGALGKGLMEDLPKFFNWLADIINALAILLHRSNNEGSGTFNPYFDNGKKPVNSYEEYLKNSQEAVKTAMDRHTDAMDRHSSTMDKHANAMSGTFGRSDRLKDAIPGGISGEALRRGLQSAGFSVPAF